MFSPRAGILSLGFVVAVCATLTYAQVQRTYHPQQRIPVVITNDLCSDCDIRNAIGYSAHPTDCNKYLQCFPAGNGEWRAVVRRCPPGLFWQHRQLTCSRPDQVDCGVNDRCYGIAKMKKSDDDDCRAFWVCNGDRSVDMDWCGPFQRYDDDMDDCDDDRSCVDDDLDDHDMPRPRPCPYEEDDMDESKYYVYEWGRKREMPCPPNTAFSWNTCGCNIVLPGSGRHGCKAELYLPFDTDFRDHAGGNWVDNRGAYLRAVSGAVGGRAAYFNGNASVLVPRFSGHDFGQTVLIKVRYLEDDGRSRLQAVITNSDCFLVPSIAIADDNEQSSTKGILRTGVNSEYFTHMPNARGVWKDVTYRYNGKAFVTTNGNSDGVTATGTVRVVHSALHIGDGSGMANFKGFIDEVYVYLCNP